MKHVERIIKALFVRTPKQSVPIQVRFDLVRRDPLRIRMDEWRKTPDLVADARSVLSDLRVRRMLDCLRNEHLGFNSLPLDTPEPVCTALHRQAEGYHAALNNFEALAVFQEPAKELTATFEPDEQIDVTNQQ